MGCINIKGDNYWDTNHIEENDIRKFESHIQFKNQISSSTNILTEEKFIKMNSNNNILNGNNFHEDFHNLINTDYFIEVVKKEKFYNNEKILILLFLLASDKIVDYPSGKYHEKVF